MSKSAAFKVTPIIIAVFSIVVYFWQSEDFTNPVTGREYNVGLEPEQEEQLGMQGFTEVLSKSRRVESGPQFEMVQRVAKRLINVARDDAPDFEWYVALVDENQINAFCLPGGKIVIYTGILGVAQSEAGLATVMGHEIAHAIARHGAERVFDQGATEMAMQGVQGSISGMDPAAQQKLLGLLGAGAKFGVLLPFSRSHELEADEMGLYYMAEAGYDPREASKFWQRMSQAGGGKPPEFMSTHPSDSNRIAQIEKLLPKAMELYNASRR